MNIALITSGHLINRTEATWLTTFNLAKEFLRKGHTVFILAQKHPDLPLFEEVEGVPICRFEGGSLGKFQYLKRFLATARNLKMVQEKYALSFDILQGFCSSPTFILDLKLAQRYARKAKIVITMKSYSKYKFPIFFSSLLNLADLVTAPTTIAARKITQKGCSSQKIKVIRSNIDIEKFKPRDKKALKKKYGLSKKKVVLYYGALRREKGVDSLIRSIPLVIKKHAEAHFLFLIRSAEIEARKYYLSLAASLNCLNHVEITFEKVAIEEFVSMADMTVLAYPTLEGTEGNPSCLLESMASKTAVVTTALPELLEIVQPNEEVLMAKPGDYLSLAQEINRLLDDRAWGEQLLEKAFAKAKHFSTARAGEEFLKIYSALQPS